MLINMMKLSNILELMVLNKREREREKIAQR
jgi:hypothetical protein